MSIFRGATVFDALTPMVRRLLFANVVVFFVQMVFSDIVVPYLGLTPILVIKKFWLWQPLTYAFVHASGWHLFFNMFALWMFGPHIESAWGSRAFLRYYLVCAVGAALTQFLVAPYSLVIGASGAIYGLLLAFGLLFPDSVIYLFFVFPLRAIQAVMFIAALTLVFAMSSGGSRIAHFAHLGGLVTGFLLLKAPVWRSRFRSWRGTRVLYHPKGRKRTPVKPDLSNEVDRILEKISAKGVNSLTAEEHETMRRYAERKQ